MSRMQLSQGCHKIRINPIFSLSPADGRLPSQFRERLGAAVPSQLTAIGNLDLLSLPKTGLFCSARCPGSAILGAYDQAAKWRDECRCIISGFHSPTEKECLRILLRGKQPIIICPARSLPQRFPPEWRQPLVEGRLLLLSGFKRFEKRITTELAIRRNEFVAALADEVYFAYIVPGGQAEQLAHRLTKWHLPFRTIE